MVSKKWWKKCRLTSERNLGKNTQNDKIIINTIYMKPYFPIIKKLSENCNVKCTFILLQKTKNSNLFVKNYTQEKPQDISMRER